MPAPIPVPLWTQLRAWPLFAVLDDATLTDVVAHAKRHEYPRGATIFMQGDMVNGLYWLEAGWLKAVKQSAAGREQILRFLEPLQTVYEVGALIDQPAPITLVVLEDAAVWVIPQEIISRLLRENGAFAQHVIGVLASRMQHLVNLVEDLSLRPVIGRLAQLILESATGDVLHRPRWYTQAELAARLGTVPDVVQRTLRGLEADGLIRVGRTAIHILNRTQLAHVADAG